MIPPPINIAEVRRVTAEFEADMNNRFGSDYKIKVTAVVSRAITMDVEDYIELLTDTICKAADIPVVAFKSKNRNRTLVMARQLFCYLLYLNYPSLTLQQIGKQLNYHHCTVLHSKDAVVNYLSIKDYLFMPFYNKVNDLLNPTYAAPATNIQA